MPPPWEKTKHLAQRHRIDEPHALCMMLFSVLLALSGHSYAEQASTIVKWKDDKGVTHYADKIPAEYANRDSAIARLSASRVLPLNATSPATHRLRRSLYRS